MRLTLSAVAAIASLSLVLDTPVFADCSTRHFYNNSPFVFTIQLDKGSCSISPKMEGPGKSSHEFSNTSGSGCIIESGDVAELHYANGGSQDGVTIKSSGGTYRDGQHFNVSIPYGYGRCYIKHEGNTADIVVNSDADGDIATCGDLFREGRDNGHNGGYPCR